MPKTVGVGPASTLRRPYSELAYVPMLELLNLLNNRGFTCWTFSGVCTDFMRAWAADVYGIPAHRVIGKETEAETYMSSVPKLVKAAAVQVIHDGPQEPSSIHRCIGERPSLTAGNTDGDLEMLRDRGEPGPQPATGRSHTDHEREYAYDRDRILDSGRPRGGHRLS